MNLAEIFFIFGMRDLLGMMTKERKKARKDSNKRRKSK
jgi:hypothetical protein